MNGRAIRIVYGKELRDSLRDRRTIISMIVVPGAGHAAVDVRRRVADVQNHDESAAGDSAGDDHRRRKLAEGAFGAARGQGTSRLSRRRRISRTRLWRNGFAPW